ncbi:MAG TPA: bacterioferritin [Chloroflexi bacterium]|nr:MAG: bacterioferritin [Chloroflexota bacterium]HDD54630.1 bacterioferritin [Chloroflexota bacterium]
MYEKSIELFNKAVADELYAVHQYMYFHFHCEDQGYGRLAGLFLRTAIEEMGHIERCAERLIFLGGDVEMVAAGAVKKEQDVKKMLQQARKMEEESFKDYNIWANECASNNDAGSRQVFEGLVADEERHYEQYDDEVKKIERFGQNYLALQALEGGSEESVE